MIILRTSEERKQISTVRDKQAMGMTRKGEERCSQFCGFQVSWCRVFKSAPVKGDLWVLETLIGLVGKGQNKSIASFLLFHPGNPQEQMFHVSQQQFL